MTASIYIRLLTIHKGDIGLFLEAQWDLLMSTLSGIVVYFLSLKYLLLQVCYLSCICNNSWFEILNCFWYFKKKKSVPFCPMCYPTFSLFFLPWTPFDCFVVNLRRSLRTLTMLSHLWASQWLQARVLMRTHPQKWWMWTAPGMKLNLRHCTAIKYPLTLVLHRILLEAWWRLFPQMLM